MRLHKRQFEIAEGITLTGHYWDTETGSGTYFQGRFNLPLWENSSLIHAIEQQLNQVLPPGDDGQPPISSTITNESLSPVLIFNSDLEAAVLATARRLAQAQPTP